MEKEQLKSLLTNYKSRSDAIEQSIGATAKRIKMLESSIPTLMIWKKWKDENRIPKIDIDELIEKQVELRRQRKINQSEEKLKFMSEFKSMTPPVQSNQGDSLSLKIDCLRRLQCYIIQEKMIKKKINELEEKQTAYRSALEELVNPVKQPQCAQIKANLPFLFKQKKTKPCECEPCSCEVCLGRVDEELQKIETQDVSVETEDEELKAIEEEKESEEIHEEDGEKDNIDEKTEKEEEETKKEESKEEEAKEVEEIKEEESSEEQLSEKEEDQEEQIEETPQLKVESFQIEEVKDDYWDELETEPGQLNLQDAADKLKTAVKILQKEYMNVDCQLIGTFKEISKFISLTAETMPEDILNTLGQDEIEEPHICAAIGREPFEKNELAEAVSKTFSDKGIDVMSQEEEKEEEGESEMEPLKEEEQTEETETVEEEELNSSKSESGCEVSTKDDNKCTCNAILECPGRLPEGSGVLNEQPSVISDFVNLLNELKSYQEKFKDKINEVKCLCQECKCEKCVNHANIPEIDITDHQQQSYDVCDICDCEVCACNIICQKNVLSALASQIPCCNSDFSIQTATSEQAEEKPEENIESHDESKEEPPEESAEPQEEIVEETTENAALTNKWKNKADEEITFEDLEEMVCTCQEECTCSKCPDKMTSEELKAENLSEGEDDKIKEGTIALSSAEASATKLSIKEVSVAEEKASEVSAIEASSVEASSIKASEIDTNEEQIVGITDENKKKEFEQIEDESIIAAKPSLISNYDEMYNALQEQKNFFEGKITEVKCHCKECKCETCTNHIPEPQIDTTDQQRQTYEPCDRCECHASGDPCICNIICQKNVLCNLAKTIPCTGSQILSIDESKKDLFDTDSCQPIQPCSCGETGSCHCLCKACPCSDCKMVIERSDLPCDCPTPCECAYCPDCVCQCTPCECKKCPDNPKSSYEMFAHRENFLSNPTLISCECGPEQRQKIYELTKKKQALQQKMEDESQISAAGESGKISAKGAFGPGEQGTDGYGGPGVDGQGRPDIYGTYGVDRSGSDRQKVYGPGEPGTNGYGGPGVDGQGRPDLYGTHGTDRSGSRGPFGQGQYGSRGYNPDDCQCDEEISVNYEECECVVNKEEPKIEEIFKNDCLCIDIQSSDNFSSNKLLGMRCVGENNDNQITEQCICPVCICEPCPKLLKNANIHIEIDEVVEKKKTKPSLVVVVAPRDCTKKSSQANCICSKSKQSKKQNKYLVSVEMAIDLKKLNQKQALTLESEQQINVHPKNKNCGCHRS